MAAGAGGAGGEYTKKTAAKAEKVQFAKRSPFRKGQKLDLSDKKNAEVKVIRKILRENEADIRKTHPEAATLIKDFLKSGGQAEVTSTHSDEKWPDGSRARMRRYGLRSKNGAGTAKVHVSTSMDGTVRGYVISVSPTNGSTWE